ncbi:MAG: hypothetical protein HFH14_03560 [Lachnospiraceae bacterium]|nr:hypothetical protein [Lachnospiraceae bacterium]
MRKMRKLCAAMSVLLTVAVAAPMLSGSTPVDAAKKPKLSKSKLTMTVGSSKTLKVKNYKKKVTWKTSKKAVAKLSSVKKTSVKVTAKKKGSAKVTATVKVSGKKKVLTCKVTVNPKTVATPAPDVPTPAPATPTPAATVTVDPNATPSPTPAFDYDNYAGCLWKNPGDKIKEVFGEYFVSGISTDLGSLRFGERAALVRYHFGSVTMGNENKMESIVNDDATDLYPEGLGKANVNNYYATKGQGKVILDYTTLEKVLSYCKANGIKLRYHAFVWHSQVREYFFLQDFNWSDYELEDYRKNGWDESNYHKLADPETMKKRLNDYIDQVIEYIYSHGYGDVVYAYDVINEATNGDGGNIKNYYVNEDASSIDEILSTSGSGLKFQTNGGVRTKSKKPVSTDSTPAEIEDMLLANGRVPANDSYWYATMGPDYLYLSFLAAHNAVEKYYEQYKTQFNYQSKPSLIYNDYNTRENDHIALAKYINKACNLANGTQGVSYCDGIGLQSHGISENVQERMIKNIADAGFEVQITELDEGITGEPQAVKMKKLYNIYKDYSKKGEYGKKQGNDYIGVTSVTQWGICDGDGSWGSGNITYVFEEYEGDDPNLKLQPKPAFFAILQAGGVQCGDKVY